MEKNLTANPQKNLQIKEHLRELINRFYVWVVFFIIGSIFGYLKYQSILSWLIEPLKKPLFYTSPTGGFEAVFTISVMIGFIVSFPIFIYQIIKFIEPVNDKSKLNINKIIIYISSSSFLAIVGILISYYLVFPASLNFLSKFGSNQLESLISTKDYFSFISKYLIGFAVLFQLPLVIYIASLFIPINAKILLNNFKYVFAFSFLIAAILTPTPDFINQTIMAAPIIILYIVTILILSIRQFIVK